MPAQPKTICHVFKLRLETWPFPLWVGLAASPGGLRRVVIESDRLSARAALKDVLGDSRLSWTPLTQYAEFFRRYAWGEARALAAIKVDLSGMSAFRRRVLRRVRGIAFGRTRSYGEVAATVGSPRAARAVGTAMAKNPLPLVVPCHRVLGGAGRLGGYSACGGTALKKALLMHERWSVTS